MTDTHVLSPRGALAIQVGEMGELQNRIIAKDIIATRKIQAILRQLEEETRPLIEELEQKAQKATEDATTHKAELLEGNAKSVKFITGVVQWRTGRDSLSVIDEAVAIEYIRHIGKLRAYTYIPARRLARKVLTADPDIVKDIPGIEIVSGASITFTPTQTNVAIADTLKAGRKILEQADKAKED